MRKVSVFFGILFFSLLGSSPIIASEVLTLEESIKIALERALSVKSAEEEIKAKEFEERSAKADFFPKFSTDYSYIHIDDETVNDAKYTINSTQISPLEVDTYDFNVTGTQPIFTGWALTITRELASLGVDTAVVQKETAIQSLVLDVKGVYFLILKAEKLEKVAKQAVEQLKAHLRVSQAFYEEGLIAKNDVLETEVQMAEARLDLIRATNRVEIAKSHFNKLLRRGLNEKVMIEDILDYHPVRLTLEECMGRAELNRPEIKEVALNVASAEKNVGLSKSSYYPSVSLIGNYERKTATRVFLEQRDPDIWTITLKAEWTFWEWGKKRHEVASARAQLAKTKHLLEEIKDNIQLEVKDAYLFLREAVQSIQVAGKAVDQAEENFRMNEERFKQQVATSTDVLDAQTLLTQARTNYFNALSEHNIAWAKLERAMGIGYEGGGGS